MTDEVINHIIVAYLCYFEQNLTAMFLKYKTLNDMETLIKQLVSLFIGSESLVLKK